MNRLLLMLVSALIVIGASSGSDPEESDLLRLVLIPRHVNAQSAKDTISAWISIQFKYKRDTHSFYFPSIGPAFMDTAVGVGHFNWNEAVSLPLESVGYRIEVWRAGNESNPQIPSDTMLVTSPPAVESKYAVLALLRHRLYFPPSKVFMDTAASYNAFYLLMAFRPEDFGMNRGVYMLRVGYHCSNAWAKFLSLDGFVDCNDNLISNAIQVKVN